MSRFSYSWSEIKNHKVLKLTSDDGGHQSYCLIAPSYGANLLRYNYRGRNIIDYDEQKLFSDFTGTPVLYPTPNRVKNSMIYFRGQPCLQEKKGKVIPCHGLIYDEAFAVGDIVENESSISVDMKYLIDQDNEIYRSFPFAHMLTITFQLFNDRIRIIYEIQNRCDDVIPFGFGLHPYFNCHGRVKLTLPSDLCLENDDKAFPTTNILKTQNIMDLYEDNGWLRDDVEINTDFIVNPKLPTVLTLPDENLSIQIRTSDEFKHLMVYKPVLQRFICLENQTCSINAHNLAAEKFPFANIIEAPPRTIHHGFVEYKLRGK